MDALPHPCWVIIPAHNEEKHLRVVLQSTKRVLGKHAKSHILVVDDGSSDETGQIAAEEQAILLTHIVNMGKGAALKTGCDYAHGQEELPMVVIDADAQHDPAQLPTFLEALKGHDVVLSFRPRNKNMPTLLRFGNNLINSMIKITYGISVKDSQSGYRAFRWAAYPKIRWKANDYSMESEMIARMAKQKLTFAQVKIKTVYQDRYKGTTIFDGIKIMRDLIWWKLTKL